MDFIIRKMSLLIGLDGSFDDKNQHQSREQLVQLT